MLYFVDSIRSGSNERQNNPNEDTLNYLVLHNAESDNASEVISVAAPSRLLVTEDGREVVEGRFVEYDVENPLSLFQDGDHSYMARRLKARFAYFRDELQSIQDDEDFELPKYGEHVSSFHVNVGHGNCSVILDMKDDSYSIMMVDCCTKEFKGRTFEQNLASCLAEVAKRVGKDVESLKIRCFMLTHPHYDHYNGIEYLIANGHIDRNTVFYMNTNYFKPSPTMVRILQDLSIIGVKIIEPIRKTLDVLIEPTHGINILFPECRIVKKKTYPLPAVPVRIEGKTNNASVVYSINLAEKTMIFPGDLEKSGFDKMTDGSYCIFPLLDCDYYCISHHGSQTGHVDIPCLSRPRLIIDCVFHNLKHAILMGRDNAYPGIYSPKVLNDFQNYLIKSEVDNNGNPSRFVEIDWIADLVTYY